LKNNKFKVFECNVLYIAIGRVKICHLSSTSRGKTKNILMCPIKIYPFIFSGLKGNITRKEIWLGKYTKDEK